jgi:flagellar basal body-associated protein FliL
MISYSRPRRFRADRRSCAPGAALQECPLMAKEPAKSEAAKPVAAAAAGAPAKKSSLKVLVMVAMVLVLEGGTVGVTIMLSGAPAKVEGHGPTPDLAAEESKLVEVLVVKDRFANQRTGRTYLYDTEIFITVRAKDNPKVKEKVESMQAQLSTEIATIFRRAEPAHLLEPTLATLTRQVKAALDERLGKDAEGKPAVQEVLIRKCIQIPVGL